MAGMGPAPKPAGTRQRRNATVPMTSLPSKGRDRKRAPNWPLPADIGMKVRQEMAAEDALRLEQELTECEGTGLPRLDGRTRRRLEGQLARAKATSRTLAEQIKREERLERELWRDLWRTPQADIWEKLAWDREVAQYARWKVRGELGDLDAAKEARQWSDRLGLNPLAMLRLRWEIERTEDAEERGARRRRPPAGPAPAARAGTDPRAVLRSVK